MGPLLFIFTVMATSLHVAIRLSHEATWFTYYLGGVAGLLVSSMILEIWTRQTRKHEKPEFPRYEL